MRKTRGTEANKHSISTWGAAFYSGEALLGLETLSISFIFATPVCHKRATMQIIIYHLPVGGGKTQQTWPDHCWSLLSGNWPGFISSILNCFFSSSRKQIAKRFSEEPKKLTIWKCVNVGGRLEISFFGEPTYDNWSTRRCTVTTIRSAGGLFLSRMGEALQMISSGMSLV